MSDISQTYDGSMPASRFRLFASLLERLREQDLPSDEAIQAAADGVARAMGTEVATIYVWDAGSNELVLAATRGLARSGVGFVTLKLGEGISGVAAQQCGAISSADVSIDPTFKLIPGFDQSRYRSILAVPVSHEGEVVGVLNVQSIDVRHYDARDTQELMAMAGLIAPRLARYWRQGDLALRLRGPNLLSSVEGIVAASLGPAEMCAQVTSALSVILPEVRCSVAYGTPELLETAGAAPGPAVAKALASCAANGVSIEASVEGLSILALPLLGESLVCGSLALSFAVAPDCAAPPWQAPHVRQYLSTLAGQVGIALERLLATRPEAAAPIFPSNDDSSLNSELVDLVLSDKGLDAVLQRASEAFGVVIGVLDVFGAPLAGEIPASPATDLPLRAGDQPLGRMLASGSPQVRAGLEGVAQVVSLELAKWKVRFEVESRLRGDVLEVLLSGAATDDRELQARASLVGLDFRRVYTPVMFAFDISAGAELTSPLAMRSLVRAVHRHYGEPPGAVVFYRPEGILALVSNCDTGLIKGIGEILRDFKALAGLESVGTGIGAAARVLTDYPSAVKKASLTASLALKLGAAGPISSERLGVYSLLLAIVEQARLREFVDEHLRPLLSQDEKTGGELIRTLEAYHAGGERLRPAAESLFVHVNTLKYRLARIEALTGRSLDDPIDRFNMYLALYALRLVEPGRPTLLPNEVVSLVLSSANNVAAGVAG